MAITLDPATKVFSIPQADLTLVTGTLYDADTDAIRTEIEQLLDDENYIWMDTAISHNSEVTVAGTTFARTIELVNSYSITFTPDTQWTVRLNGSNNNIFDVENGVLNQNQVQVITGNSGGLIDASADQVWDAATADHNTNATFGMLGSLFLASGLATGTPTTTSIETDISEASGYYTGQILQVIDGTENMTRLIIDYENTNGTFTLETALPFTPSAGAVVRVLPF